MNVVAFTPLLIVVLAGIVTLYARGATAPPVDPGVTFINIVGDPPVSTHPVYAVPAMVTVAFVIIVPFTA